MPTSSDLVLGPEHGELTLHTGRAGIVAKVGHDLTLVIEQWNGLVAFRSGSEVERVRLVADLNSLQVVRGDGGIASLSRRDKATIRKEALKTLDVRRHPEVTFDSETVTSRAGGYVFEGTVTIAGVPQQLAVRVEVAEGATRHVASSVVITQSDFGIKPYSNLLGALRVSDDVEVRIDLTVDAVDNFRCK